jgi:hypothetical protein
MKLVDSSKKQLDYGQILHAYHSNEKHTDKRLEDFKVWMITMAATFAKIKGEGEIIGNTFFYYRRGPEGHQHQAMMWAFNADTLQNMSNNLTEFATQLSSMGVTDIFAVYKNPAVSRAVRQAFAKIKSGDGDVLKIKKYPSGEIAAHVRLLGEHDV